MTMAYLGRVTLELPPRSELAVLGMRDEERARYQRLNRGVCPSCQVGATPRDALRPFYVAEDGEIRAGWKCPCQRLR